MYSPLDAERVHFDLKNKMKRDTPIIVMYTLITKIWDKLGDKTGRSTLEIRLFITFQREESKKIQTYSIYMHIT